MSDPAHILLVDDDEGTRFVLTSLLDEQGYKVRACPNAEQALTHIVADDSVDVVISDLKLPDGSGLNILWSLKKIRPDVALILITGHASVDTAIDAVNEGAFAYHVKPLDVDGLNHSIRIALKQQRLTIENRVLLQRLQQANEELGAANTREIGKNRELEQASIGKTQILSTVTHELKTPLTNILGHVDRMLLQRDRVGPLNQRQQMNLETVQRNAQQLKALIDNLLDVSRIESGSLELALEELDVRKAIEDVVSSMEAEIAGQWMTVELDIPSSLSRVKADLFWFAQIMGNLLSNACKYSPANATTTVTAREEAGLVQIAVVDSGIGISEDHQSRLFSKFFRVDNSSTREESGTGLGLFITKSIIEAHKGRIWVESLEGTGSTFSFTLPMTAVGRTDLSMNPPHHSLA